tara:strand:+ start:865 stop:2817 length:1953 start_codon:yes stop_codon:yes gene_type:complete
MKRILSLITLIYFSCFNIYGQEIMKISDVSISLDEFRNTLMKNNDEQKITKEYLDEYVDLFINYKMKVIEAKELNLDKDQSFINELEGYRKQLAKPYLQNKEFKENLIKEAYDRMQYDVHASHILFPIKDHKDSLDIYKKALSVKSSIERGEITFLEAVNKYSDEIAKNNNGDLGYFTAFDMVYSFETASYNTSIGKVSDPVKTKFGYHLVKVHDKRDAFGQVKVSHIMFKISESLSKSQINEAKRKIDEVYQKLSNGENFSDLANRYSEDRSTAVKGGVLPWFGLNRMAKEFEEASFSLENIGEFTEPFLTEFGWHIVILDGKKRVGSFEDERSQIKRLIEKGSRNKIIDVKFIERLKKEYGFQEHKYIEYRKRTVKNDINLDKLESANLTIEDIKRTTKDYRYLFSVDNIWYTQEDFKDFILENQQVGLDFELIYNRFVDFKFLELEESKLEDKYPEYKSLLNEFRDGILLFELTSKKVWNKAIQDSIGLNEFYERNIDLYQWKKRIEANIYTCSKTSLFTLRRMLWKKSKGLVTVEDIKDKVNKDSPLNLNVVQGKFEIGDNQYIDYVSWNEGNTELDASDFEDILKDEIVVVEVIGVLDPISKKLSETRGKVISDYQNFLEKAWVDQLKLKYPVKINRDILYSIIN